MNDLSSPSFTATFSLNDNADAKLDRKLTIEGLHVEADTNNSNNSSETDNAVVKLLDPQIDSGVEWLLNTVIQDFSSLNTRVSIDTKKNLKKRLLNESLAKERFCEIKS